MRPISRLAQLFRGKNSPPFAPAVAAGVSHESGRDRLLTGRVALVTGGAGLIGSAVCEALAGQGAKVVVHYFRRRKEAEHLATRLASSGAEAIAAGADIREQAQVRAMVESVASSFGDVDVLVNNASTVPPEVGMRGFLEHTWDDYQRYIDTILKGAFNCSQAVLPQMVEKRNGRIINIGTAALHEINGHLNPYVTAKGGLLGMTRSLAEEFGKHNITANQVAPGWMYPDPRREPPPSEGRLFRDRSPLGNGLAHPRDVASAVAFLASDSAGGVTGLYLPVCAGQVVTV